MAPRAWTPYRPRPKENCIKHHGICANALYLHCRALSNIYQISGTSIKRQFLDLGSSIARCKSSSLFSPTISISAERRISFSDRNLVWDAYGAPTCDGGSPHMILAQRNETGWLANSYTHIFNNDKAPPLVVALACRTTARGLSFRRQPFSAKTLGKTIV